MKTKCLCCSTSPSNASWDQRTEHSLQLMALCSLWGRMPGGGSTRAGEAIRARCRRRRRRWVICGQSSSKGTPVSLMMHNGAGGGRAHNTCWWVSSRSNILYFLDFWYTNKQRVDVNNHPLMQVGKILCLLLNIFFSPIFWLALLYILDSHYTFNFLKACKDCYVPTKV